VAGALVGTVVLGVGGRFAMRAIAVETGQRPGFSLGGSGTVVFLGAASGALGGLILAIARAILARRPRAAAAVYWIALLALALRGLRPLDPLRLAWFIPLVVVYGAALQWLSARQRRRSGTDQVGRGEPTG
jgi:hypothetical protein